MQISLKWINELIHIETVSLENLINKLTLGGFEVEEILTIEIKGIQTITLEISATANRSDSLSIQGLSLEIASLLNDTNKTSNYLTNTCFWTQQIETFNFKNLTQKNNFDFCTLVINNLEDLSSPLWLKHKLIASGLIPNNNLTDFQNYILLETGNPIEFYDFEKIFQKSNNFKFELSIRNISESTTFLANNNVDYELNENISILYANQFPISIAGIIPSKESTYSHNTKSLLVEASIFNPTKIRQQSRLLGLRTERSSRYEKSLKNINSIETLYRLVSLLRIANPKLTCKLHTIAQSKKRTSKIIKLNYQTVKQVLGPINKITTANSEEVYEYVSPKTITKILKQLQFSVEYKNYSWNVAIPLRRSEDVSEEIDIIEEIGRIYGFDKFLTRLPQIKKIGSEEIDYRIRKKVTLCLISLGLNELIQYSFENEDDILKIDHNIKLINPLTQDYSNLRTSLLPNLIKSVEENLKNSSSFLEGFEHGRIFHLDSNFNIIETESLAGILGGIQIKSSWFESSRSIYWFEAKGRLDQLFKRLNIITYWEYFRPLGNIQFFHTYRTARIFSQFNEELGVFGQISPVIAKKLNLSNDTYLFELDFEKMKLLIQQNKLAIYKEYPLYPKIIKDFSFIVDNNISFQKIKKLLYLNGTHFLKEINLLDKYKSKAISQSQTSLCIQLIFQSELKTLETKEVEKILDHLTNVLIMKFNAIIRM